jgi:hypothetical protein
MSDKPDNRESVDYDLVQKGMAAGERAAMENRVGRGLKPRIWAVLLILLAVLVTRLVSGLSG